MEFIDLRGRPPTPEVKAYFIPEHAVHNFMRFVGAKSISPAYVAGSVKMFFDEMEEAGITKTVFTGRNAPALSAKQSGYIPNDCIHDMMKQYPDKVIGVAGIDLANKVHNALEEAERCVDLGFKGVHIEPARSLNAYYNDERLFPFYEKCIQLDTPVFFMTGPMVARTLDFENPVHIQDVAARYPDLKIVVSHGCWPYVTEILAVCFKCRNVFLSPDIWICMPGGEQYVKAADSYLQDQFLFGTAYPARPLKQSVDDFKAFPINPIAMEKAAHKNAEKLLKL